GSRPGFGTGYLQSVDNSTYIVEYVKYMRLSLYRRTPVPWPRNPTQLHLRLASDVCPIVSTSQSAGSGNRYPTLPSPEMKPLLGVRMTLPRQSVCSEPAFSLEVNESRRFRPPSRSLDCEIAQ